MPLNILYRTSPKLCYNIRITPRVVRFALQFKEYIRGLSYDGYIKPDRIKYISIELVFG